MIVILYCSINLFGLSSSVYPLLVDFIVLSYVRMQISHITIHGEDFFLSFMLSSVLSKVWLTVSFSSDLNYNFFDICSDDKRLVKTEENIILNKPGQHLEECRCFIHGEKFSISVNDLRLQSKLDANCSLSTVSIQSTKFSCEHEEVPVFKKEIEHLLQRAFVAVTLNGTDAVPQMIWLTLIPNGE